MGVSSNITVVSLVGSERLLYFQLNLIAFNKVIFNGTSLVFNKE